MKARSHSVQGSAADGIAVVTIDNPPVNVLSHEARVGLGNAIRSADQDDSVLAILLVGAGRAFCAGADVREFDSGTANDYPHIGDLIAIIEACRKPVVAAIRGVAFGGGLELAMGCHYRVADAEARVGQLEINFGLIPGAGGTQRLPRLVGVLAALQMILSGEVIPVTDPRVQGLIDRIVSSGEDTFIESAIQFAKEMSLVRPLPRTRDLALPEHSLQSFAEARARMRVEPSKLPVKPRRPFVPGHYGAIDAVEAAAVVPFDQGLAVEQSLFMELMHSKESQALRYAFFAERRAAEIAGLPQAGRPLAACAVVGAGTMGTGIAFALLSAGLPVVVVEFDRTKISGSSAQIDQMLSRAVEKGTVTASAAEATRMRLSFESDLGAVADADLIIEAVYEDLAVKREVFSGLDRVAKPGAVLATNTSTLDVDVIAGFTSRPADVLGLHFFSPAQVMRLVEVVRGRATSPDVLRTGLTLTKRLGKVGVVAGVCDGFIGNRLVEEYFRQATFLLEEGLLPHEIDAALESFGFAMGPFRVADLAGLDIGWAIRKRRSVERPAMPYSKVIDKICELGRYGQKTGAGVYRYPDSRRAVRDPEVEALILAHSAELGIQRRTVSEEEIVTRCVLALVNEGARVLEEGIAQRASDIDVVYVTGYGFPAQRGGPMYLADSLGLSKVVATMRRLAESSHGDRAFWRPSPLIERLAASGETLAAAVFERE